MKVLTVSADVCRSSYWRFAASLEYLTQSSGLDTQQRIWLYLPTRLQYLPLLAIL
jgi:hypothetical protein